MTTTMFRADNTQGYVTDDLAALNAEWVRQGGPQIEDEDEAARLAERILRAFDRERSAPAKCIYCDHAGPFTHGSDVPSKHDDDAWAAIAREHADDCEWVLTRAHRSYVELLEYGTGISLGTATAAEIIASLEAARHDGGVGVITVGGVRCYVQE